MSSNEAWPEVLVVQLRALWAEGLSTSKIGQRLSVSKNAVVGKASRLHLPRRPSPILQMNDPNHVPRREKPTRIRDTSMLPPLVETGIVTPRSVLQSDDSMDHRAKIVAATVRGPALMPQRTATCQFALSDKRPWRFCDAPAAPGSAYCADHHVACHARNWAIAA